MRERKLERRIDGIISWLERMKSSYRQGQVESAYMDVECARADLEDLRTDVFSGISMRRQPSILPKVITLAVIVMMMMVKPLSREIVPEYVPVAEIHEEARPIEEAPKPAPVQAKKPPKPRKPRKTLPRSDPPKPPSKAEPAKTVAQDKIYMLVEAGQRAMKGDKTVIMIK